MKPITHSALALSQSLSEEGLLKTLEDYGKDSELIPQLPEPYCMALLFVGLLHQPKISKTFKMALTARCAPYWDKSNGGLNADGLEKFADHPEVLALGEKHRVRRRAAAAETKNSSAAEAATPEEARPTSESRSTPSGFSIDAPYQVPVEKLVPHPWNQEIYNEDPKVDEALVDSLERHGQLEPIVVTANFTILSGHRRWRACRARGMTMVTIVVRHVEPENEVEVLLSYNAQRLKQYFERLREYGAYLCIERERAAARQRQGKSLPENFPEGEETGEARDLAAKRIGLSGRMADIGYKVVVELDKRKQNGGSAQEIAAVTAALNKSILAGYKAAQKYGWFPWSSKGAPEQKAEDSAAATADPVAAAIKSTATVLETAPAALQAFNRTLPTVRKMLGSSPSHNQITTLRRWGKAILKLADHLEKEEPLPPAAT